MEVDTIVAVVTPPGEGAVGIVRVSGPTSRSLGPELFPGVAQPWTSHQMRHGELFHSGEDRILDDALACFMQAPRSYTGEDVFEIHCHGNPLVLEQVVALCLTHGCRAARPGEFTLRAFLNGKLDLSQAEAVLDIVRAPTNAGLHIAVSQLRGWVSEQIEPLRQTLVKVTAHMEAMVDFVEDDIPPAVDEETAAEVARVLEAIDELLKGAQQGIVLREGAALAIVGSPNVGKSSIMNRLLGMERSIVTPIAGTTRDTVEETVSIRDIPFRVVDTAGINDAVNIVEQIGVARTRETIGRADVVLLVLDRSRPFGPRDQLTVQAVATHRGDDARQHSSDRLIVCLNKNDLPPALMLDGCLSDLRPAAVVESNTVTDTGLETLRHALAAAALGGVRQEHVVSNVRHQDALRLAAESLRTALDGVRQRTPLDLVSLDVRAAAQALGEIPGINVDEEVLDRIFRDFCIGK